MLILVEADNVAYNYFSRFTSCRRPRCCQKTGMTMKGFGIYRKLATAVLLGLVAAGASAQGVLKIGEINSYKKIPAFLGPYNKGMDLALDQVNDAGGGNRSEARRVGKEGVSTCN